MNLLEKETRGRQRGEAQHEEVQTRERDQVHGQLPQVAVQLTRETQAHGGHKVVQVTEGLAEGRHARNPWCQAPGPSG